MYSIILMTALSSAPDAPSFGGSWFNTCTLDSCCPTRYGWKSYGCVQYTPIYTGCGGCYGSCYGCSGYHHGCIGYHYGCGGCFGYGQGYWNFDGPSYGAGYGGFGAYGNYGHYGSYSVYPQAPIYSSPTIGVPYNTKPLIDPVLNPNNTLPTPFEPLTKPKEIRDVRPLGTNLSTATIVVEVPEEAEVYIDGHKMKSKAARRVFTTPAIRADQDYYYNVKVVIDQDGKKAEDTQRIVVRGGEQTAASFARLNRAEPSFAEAPRK